VIVSFFSSFNCTNVCPLDDKIFSTLHYTAHDLDGQTTVVLIHGALVSSLYRNLVIPHRPRSYHLLISDLSDHGNLQAIGPLSVDLSARLIAGLIHTHAINGSAYIKSTSSVTV